MQKTKEKPWHEQDDFWQTVAPILFTSKRISDANEEVEQLISLLNLQSGLRVCDLCCGVGRHSLELARRGFRVTAVDRTKVYLETARGKANNEGLDIEFLQEDMRSFCRPNSFDAVINLYTSFGYFEDPIENRTVLENIYKSLKNNGKLVMDLVGKEVVARIFQERDWREEEDILILEERRLSKDWGTIENRWIVFKDGKKHEYSFSHRLYSAVELSNLLQECGFKQVDVYGDFDGSQYDHQAKRLVLVARK
jgi:SAM-dependent methyltransferase